MDCKTARLLMDFVRPEASEVDAPDATSLSHHLEQCKECSESARAQEQLDRVLRPAMRAVAPPSGFKQLLLQRLEMDRADQDRRRFARGLRMAAALAALVLVGWLGWYSYHKAMPRLQPDTIWQHAAFSSPTREQVERDFRRWGAPVAAPPQLCYAYLTSHHLAELPGYPGIMVPELVFDRDDLPTPHHARVFIVAAKQLPPDILDGPPYVSPSGAPFKLEVLRQSDEPYVCLVFHNGESLDWLLDTAPPQA